MKKILFLLIIAVSVIFSAYADDKIKIKVNGAVLSSFKNDFRHTTSVSWKQHGHLFIASFTQFDGNYQAYYTSDGNLLGFLSTAAIDDLPHDVRKVLNKRFVSAQFLSVSRFYSISNGLSFIVGLSDNGRNKFVHINRNGTVESVTSIK